MKDFIFLPFNKMKDADYAKVGFMSGLEVHQQLLTEKKLFCRCPAGRYSPEYDAEILRHMRPTLSELGEYDGTALMEFKTKKNIVYRTKHETVCTYEMDDNPPFEINPQALDIALGGGIQRTYQGRFAITVCRSPQSGTDRVEGNLHYGGEWRQHHARECAASRSQQ